MKRANSQEPKSEISHSCFPDMIAVSEQASSGNAGRSKSVAMLGLALSFGASGVLFADSEATAAVGSFVPTQSAASSESPQLPSVLNSQLVQPSVNGQGLTVYHTVEQGDSLWQIAKEHQVEVQDIKVANRISPDSPLQVGQVIKVPGEELTASQPTLVSLLPGSQRNISEGQVQAPSLDRLVATIADGDRDVTKNLQQSSDISDAVDEPVVAAEELTGDVSLRSAGLVSQSDGFQSDLEQLAANTQVASVQQTHVPMQLDAVQSETSEISEGFQAEDPAHAPIEIVETVPASPENVINTPSAAYEVLPGDTVDNIALALGTTPEELTEANGLENPDFIVTGDTLAVPEQAASKLVIAEAAESLANSSSELTASTSLSDFDGTRLSRLQSTVEVERRINAPSTLQLLRGEEEAAAAQSSEAEPIAVEDPYTADLLAEVSSAQQLNAAVRSDSEAIALRQTTPAAASTVVNPEFQGSRLEARGGSVPDVETERSELLAAAPLDPSIYVSSPAPAAGQVVSPEMPILPSADEYLPEAPDYFNGYIWPTRGTLTSGYGWRWGRMHRGIDVAGPVGTPIVSAAPGVIEKAGWNSGGYGNLVEVRHADGSMTRYAHNSRIVVRAGQRVAQGEHIADMGSTGYSTGPHLHFEVHMPDRGTVNPMAMLPSR
ncbi:peptidoglycan DD-metalloendopeptidase family protein [Leptolyngbya cf. ectocarpi LEGE 11479]|uniref:Peptidoglycan DD-metalloendopeptidase family protein n=1 Tax=Leptolyngbya cf. ectocarpi LEGE 11479 TaxID=1828722 RepID=A0A928X120_LEPEC|nr:peptidoglycan DD-metalloendopeptidase family protein [Leptolyngbya ectocarpi]MBE9065584.1 peptidoglycan DD-metalloendopeptidase family protein [Leptolyngbya cf. ectocarpi LEGE 11479]